MVIIGGPFFVALATCQIQVSLHPLQLAAIVDGGKLDTV